MFRNRIVIRLAPPVGWFLVSSLMALAVMRDVQGAVVGFALSFLTLGALDLRVRGHRVARLLTLGRFACFFLGHDVRHGEVVGDYCDTCNSVMPTGPMKEDRHGGD